MIETKVEIISPEDIRSEKMSFTDMIIRSLDRIHTIASQMTEKNTTQSIAGYEESIAVLHSFLAQYYGTKYEIEVQKIEEELTDLEYDKDRDCRKLLHKWLGLICKNLGKVGLLPPIDVIYDMATPQQRLEEETDEFQRVMRKLIEKGKKEEITEWLALDGKVVEERVKVKIPKIEDILDPVYLRK